MNQVLLGRCLGAVSPPSFQRYQNEHLVTNLTHQILINFSFSRVPVATNTERSNYQVDASSPKQNAAHSAGVNSIAIDRNDGRYLISGGADASIRLWDLEDHPSQSTDLYSYSSRTSLTRNDKLSHSHAITSLSIYPFDPVPTTLITTSHDKTLKLTSITPTELTPVYTFQLDFAPYTHSISPLPDSQPLVAVGTAHPAIRLLDLRSGLSTHSLPGHNGAVYSIAWSPKKSHILTSGAHDGRVLFFDIRRANAAFASLDLDDAIGVVGDESDPHSSGFGARSTQLSWSSLAHNGPVTSVQWTPAADKIVSTGHDQRIRVWDTFTGRNDLVHFGPRIRNDRIGRLSPLISPLGHGKPNQEVLFWPNDDAKGDIFMHKLREGNMLRILRTEGVIDRHGRPLYSAGSNIGKLTSGGRINDLCWRINANLGDGLEMYSAHGDGRICVWSSGSKYSEEDEEEGKEGDEQHVDDDNIMTDKKKKRKRDLVGEIVQGFTKKPLIFPNTL